MVALLIAIHARPGRGEVKQAPGGTPPRLGIGGAQPPVVCYGLCQLVLDFGLDPGREAATRTRAMDLADPSNDARLRRLGVGIVAGLVGRAPVLGRYG